MRHAIWTRTALKVAFPYTTYPAYGAAPFLILIVHARWYTAVIALVAAWWLKRMHAKGRTLGWAYNRLKTALRGGTYHARPLWYVRRMARVTPIDAALEYALHMPIQVEFAQATSRQAGSAHPARAKRPQNGTPKSNVQSKRNVTR